MAASILENENISLGDEVEDDVNTFDPEEEEENEVESSEALADTQPEPLEEQAPAEEPVSEEGSGSEPEPEPVKVKAEPVKEEKKEEPVKKHMGPVARPSKPGPVSRPAAVASKPGPAAATKAAAKGKASVAKAPPKKVPCPGNCGEWENGVYTPRLYTPDTLQKYKYEDGTPTGKCFKCSNPKQHKSTDDVVCEVCKLVGRNPPNSRKLRTLEDNKKKDTLNRGLLICGPCLNGPKPGAAKKARGQAPKFWCNGFGCVPRTENTLKNHHGGYCNSCDVKIQKGQLDRPKVWEGPLVPYTELKPEWTLSEKWIGYPKTTKA